MAKKEEKKLEITAPDIIVREFEIEGTAPYLQNKFSAKAQAMIKAKQEAGSQGKGKKEREAKDFTALFEGATYRMKNGDFGIPAPAFRDAIISACRIVGFTMTHAKLGVFILADGYDVDDGTPLVKIKGKRTQDERHVRLESGVCDIRVRPIFNEWSAKLRVSFDNGMFSEKDIANLLMRVGLQVGIGEGRHDSKKSAGIGLGTFKLK